MSRSLSAAALAAIYAQETDRTFLLLATISGSGFTTFRVARNNENVLSNGNTFSAYPFAVFLPDERDDRPPEMNFAIDNVNRSITDALRAAPTAPVVRLEVVLATSPDTREYGPVDLTLRNVAFDGQLVTGTLTFEDVLNEQYPGYTFNPVDFPALF